eukprot:COSAG06_NODE_848_length_11971_cov_10.199882_14_plen_139_part_00
MRALIDLNPLMHVFNYKCSVRVHWPGASSCSPAQQRHYGWHCNSNACASRGASSRSNLVQLTAASAPSSDDLAEDDSAIGALETNGPFFEFSLCLSRACLGKMFVFIYKWLKRTVFTHRMPSTLSSDHECVADFVHHV